MRARFSGAMLLGGLCVLLGSGAAFAAIDTEAFTEACNGNGSLLEQTQDDPEGLGRLCSCVEGEFAGNVSQSDIDLLSEDLGGYATDEAKMEYDTWEDLSAYASETLSNCLVIEGFADGYDPGAE